MYLLITERYDRDSVSEGAHYLSFMEYAPAETFARRLAVDYHQCPELPVEGDFESALIKGDVTYNREHIMISWTVQPRTPGGPLGDSYYIGVEPVSQASVETQLDFWNQRITDESTWDKQIERDSDEGRFDALIDQVRSDIAQGLTTPL